MTDYSAIKDRLLDKQQAPRFASWLLSFAILAWLWIIEYALLAKGDARSAWTIGP